MRGGILIIGSLLWDEHGERAAWRSQRLSLEGRQGVSVPIRYGRRSQLRGHTFTMTFDPSHSAGWAVVVPCVSPASRPEDLVDEAEALWSAEQPGATAGVLGASWGCVGLLFRERPPDAWADAWCRTFRDRALCPISPIDDNGLLRIPWPTLERGDALALDFVLATATRRECARPTPAAVADAWLDQSEGHERYFFENVRHSIRTSDDLLIWERMVQQPAPWLRREDYASAVAILTEEQGDA